MATPYGVRPGDLDGTASFRMEPDDDLASAASGASVAGAAGGRALAITYWWTHPADQQRHEGLLLLGTPDDDGAVTAAWVDSWHQPTVVVLGGSATATGALTEYEYAPGWRWQVELGVADGVPCLVMRNVVPVGEAEELAPGPYDVSRTAWT